jgi:excisionase family DNA binding protein
MAKVTAITSKRRPTRLTSVAKAAEFADVSPRTIRRWISLGRLPGYRVGPRLLKVSLDDIEALAQQLPTA